MAVAEVAAVVVVVAEPKLNDGGAEAVDAGAEVRAVTVGAVLAASAVEVGAPNESPKEFCLIND